MAFKLSEDDAKSLSNILAKYSERANYSITLDLLLDKWRSFVAQVELGYSESIYEYKNDLSTRTILQEIINEIDESLRNRLSEELQTWDERFMSATKDAIKPFHLDVVIEKYPWIFRIPEIMGEELKQDLLLGGHLSE